MLGNDTGGEVDLLRDNLAAAIENSLGTTPRVSAF